MRPDPQDNWHAQETYRSMMEYGRAMLRFVFLANGGAIIAILTFLGDLVAKGSQVPSMRCPLVIFLFGLLFGGIGGICAYLTQLVLYNEHLRDVTGKGFQSHKTWLNCTMTCILFGVLTFGIGAFLAVARLQ